MSISDDCASNIHEFCGPCDCPCHGLNLNLNEIKALYKVLEREYIHPEHQLAHQVINRMIKIIEANDELAR